jgi:hypothetical protein
LQRPSPRVRDDIKSAANVLCRPTGAETSNASLDSREERPPAEAIHEEPASNVSHVGSAPRLHATSGLSPAARSDPLHSQRSDDPASTPPAPRLPHYTLPKNTPPEQLHPRRRKRKSIK